MFLRRSLYIAALLVRTARRLSRLYCPHSCLMVSINLKVLVSTERITIQSSLTLLWMGGWDQPKMDKINNHDKYIRTESVYIS